MTILMACLKKRVERTVSVCARLLRRSGKTYSSPGRQVCRGWFADAVLVCAVRGHASGCANVRWADTVDGPVTCVSSAPELTISTGTSPGFGYELATNCCMSPAVEKKTRRAEELKSVGNALHDNQSCAQRFHKKFENITGRLRTAPIRSMYSINSPY